MQELPGGLGTPFLSTLTAVCPLLCTAEITTMHSKLAGVVFLPFSI